MQHAWPQESLTPKIATAYGAHQRLQQSCAAEAVEFLRKISHSGDTLPANAGRDAPRFIHESTSYVTTTHINHTIHACAAAAIRAAAKTMRAYALTRATNHGLLLNTARIPPVVATPVLRATNDH